MYKSNNLTIKYYKTEINKYTRYTYTYTINTVIYSGILLYIILTYIFRLHNNKSFI